MVHRNSSSLLPICSRSADIRVVPCNLRLSSRFGSILGSIGFCREKRLQIEHVEESSVHQQLFKRQFEVHGTHVVPRKRFTSRYFRNQLAHRCKAVSCLTFYNYFALSFKTFRKPMYRNLILFGSLAISFLVSFVDTFARKFEPIPLLTPEYVTNPTKEMLKPSHTFFTDRDETTFTKYRKTTVTYICHTCRRILIWEIFWWDLSLAYFFTISKSQPRNTSVVLNVTSYGTYRGFA